MSSAASSNSRIIACNATFCSSNPKTRSLKSSTIPSNAAPCSTISFKSLTCSLKFRLTAVSSSTRFSTAILVSAAFSTLRSWRVSSIFSNADCSLSRINASRRRAFCVCRDWIISMESTPASFALDDGDPALAMAAAVNVSVTPIIRPAAALASSNSIRNSSTSICAVSASSFKSSYFSSMASFSSCNCSLSRVISSTAASKSIFSFSICSIFRFRADISALSLARSL